jgi:hypothetical protein
MHETAAAATTAMVRAARLKLNLFGNAVSTLAGAVGANSRGRVGGVAYLTAS